MKLSIFCKASTDIGLGHLFRSYAFVQQVLQKYPESKIEFHLIGDNNLIKLLDENSFEIKHYANECEIKSIDSYGKYVFFDLIELDSKLICDILRDCIASACLSPIFNNLDKVNYYYSRTKHTNITSELYPNLKMRNGLEYAIIQGNCKPISAGAFEQNLKGDYFPVAIIMGGGDAKNKTLELLKGLKNCKVPATFWIMLGEGYKHSLDELTDQIREDTKHEIILAKTNSSMWHILSNCVLAILPGGITSYEAVRAGLPSINFYDNPDQEFLIKEICENNAAFNFGQYSGKTIFEISSFIEQLYYNRKLLFKMHVDSKGLIDGNGAIRIIDDIINDRNN